MFLIKRYRVYKQVHTFISLYYRSILKGGKVIIRFFDVKTITHHWPFIHCELIDISLQTMFRLSTSSLYLHKYLPTCLIHNSMSNVSLKEFYIYDPLLTCHKYSSTLFNIKIYLRSWIQGHIFSSSHFFLRCELKLPMMIL